ncbi:M50 family metallopeptidase [Robertmurraya beringensis]|uniref:M50 family metallopeptidase n=1 Tax=Robertmurraya beringensis TaxID=641660 RepID=A0ABV6KLW3_9BACI
MNKIMELFSKIYIHPLLWVVVALSVVTGHFYELLLLLIIIFTHELGHGVAASYFSWRIKKITLLPFGGVAEMDEHGNRPLREEAIVVLSGPVQHIWLVAVAYLLHQVGFVNDHLFSMFLQYNLMIFLFNLLPIWPLDGGKFVFLWLSIKKPFPKAFKQTLLLSFIALGLFSAVILVTEPLNLNVWIIISFLLFSLYYEWKQRRYVFVRFLLERYYGKKDTFGTLIPLNVEEDELVIHVLERFQRGCKHPIIIKNDAQEKRLLDENEVLHAYFADKLLMARMKDLLYQY